MQKKNIKPLPISQLSNRRNTSEPNLTNAEVKVLTNERKQDTDRDVLIPFEKAEKNQKKERKNCDGFTPLTFPKKKKPFNFTNYDKFRPYTNINQGQLKVNLPSVEGGEANFDVDYQASDRSKDEKDFFSVLRGKEGKNAGTQKPMKNLLAKRSFSPTIIGVPVIQEAQDQFRTKVEFKHAKKRKIPESSTLGYKAQSHQPFNQIPTMIKNVTEINININKSSGKHISRSQKSKTAQTNFSSNPNPLKNISSKPSIPKQHSPSALHNNKQQYITRTPSDSQNMEWMTKSQIHFSKIVFSDSNKQSMVKRCVFPRRFLISPIMLNRYSSLSNKTHALSSTKLIAVQQYPNLKNPNRVTSSALNRINVINSMSSTGYSNFENCGTYGNSSCYGNYEPYPLTPQVYTQDDNEEGHLKQFKENEDLKTVPNEQNNELEGGENIQNEKELKESDEQDDKNEKKEKKSDNLNLKKNPVNTVNPLENLNAPTYLKKVNLENRNIPSSRGNGISAAVGGGFGTGRNNLQNVVESYNNYNFTSSSLQKLRKKKSQKTNLWLNDGKGGVDLRSTITSLGNPTPTNSKYNPTFHSIDFNPLRSLRGLALEETLQPAEEIPLNQEERDNIYRQKEKERIEMEAKPNHTNTNTIKNDLKNEEQKALADENTNKSKKAKSSKIEKEKNFKSKKQKESAVLTEKKAKINEKLKEIHGMINSRNHKIYKNNSHANPALISCIDNSHSGN
jgi:hypothetical protein